MAAEPNGYALIDEGSLLDPGGASLGNRDSNVVMEGQVTVPGGTVTFSEGKVSTMTTIVISPTVSLARAEEDTSMVFPGDSEIGLDLTTGVLRDGTWIFIFPVVRLEVETFHLGSNPDAFVLSSTGHVAWARPADINVCDWHLKESLEDFLITHFGSLNGVHNNDALCLTEGVVASTDRSEMMRIIARGLGGEEGRFFLTKGQSPSAGTQIILVGKSTDEFGKREQRSHRCGRRRPFGTWQDVERV